MDNTLRTTATGAEIMDFWHNAPIWENTWIEDMEDGLYFAIQNRNLDPNRFYKFSHDFGFLLKSSTCHTTPPPTFAQAFTDWANTPKQTEGLTIQIKPGTGDEVLTLLRKHGLLVEGK